MGNSYTIEYPQIVEKNKDIKNLNKQLKKKFDEVYNSLQYHHANQKLQLESYQKVNYEVHYGKGIVSFLVENQSMIGNIKEKVEEYTIYNIDASTYEVLDTEEVKEKFGINRDYASNVKGMVVKMYLDKFRYDYNNELGVYRNSLIDESVESITYHAINRIYIDSDECIHFILYIFNPDRAETIPYNFYLDKNGKTTYEIMEWDSSSLILFFAYNIGKGENMYEDIDILDIDNIYIEDNLIDIREKYEYILGSIKRSKNIPYNYLMMMPEQYLEKDKTYYLYCDTGSKSRRVCTYLNQQGYHTVDLVGGYEHYKNPR